jgi:chromosome segregation and condensation protein ScpB
MPDPISVVAPDSCAERLSGSFSSICGVNYTVREASLIGQQNFVPQLANRWAEGWYASAHMAESELDPPSPRSRRGRRAAVPEDGVGAEIRRRRDVLGLTLREAAALTRVSPTVICEVERGSRTPSVRTYQKLRDGLGLTEPAAVLLGRRTAAVALGDCHLTTLAACVVSAGGASLGDLAAALGISIAAVREGLSVLTDRLAAVGLSAVEDGATVRVSPLAFAHDAVSELTYVEAAPRLTEEQTTVICMVGYAGAITRRRIEELRGEDCESLLRRMVLHGLLEATRDVAPNVPNLYRVTAKVLGALGYPTLESFQCALTETLTPDELMKAQQVG